MTSSAPTHHPPYFFPFCDVILFCLLCIFTAYQQLRTASIVYDQHRDQLLRYGVCLTVCAVCWLPPQSNAGLGCLPPHILSSEERTTFQLYFHPYIYSAPFLHLLLLLSYYCCYYYFIHAHVPNAHRSTVNPTRLKIDKHLPFYMSS